MSLAQISATSVLCQLLEREKPEVNGMTLLGGEYGNAGRDLLRERLLVVGASLSHVTCPECGVELARVVRDLAHENILLSCDECGEVNSPRSLQETYKVSLPKFIDRLMLGLGTQPSAKKEVATEIAWRIGVTEPVRGKPLTWYFARHLHDHRVAQRLHCLRYAVLIGCKPFLTAILLQSEAIFQAFQIFSSLPHLLAPTSRE